MSGKISSGNHSHCTVRCGKICISNTNSCFWCRSMNNLSIANVNCHMTGPIPITIHQNITRLRIPIIDSCPCIWICKRISWKRITKLSINQFTKSGAICSIGKTVSSIHIRISQKLVRIIDNFLGYREFDSYKKKKTLQAA